MFSAASLTAALLLAWARCTHAQFPIDPEGRTVLESRFGEGVTITYKEVQLVPHLSSTTWDG